MGLFTRLGTLSLGFAALLSVGCGDATLSGTVKFSDGTPLTKGVVVFTAEKAQLTAAINPDGTYVAKSETGIPSTTYQVSLSGPIFGPEEKKEAEAAPAEGAEGGATGVETLYTEDMQDDAGEALVSRKFSSGETSGLTYNGGPGKFDIVVEKP